MVVACHDFSQNGKMPALKIFTVEISHNGASWDHQCLTVIQNNRYIAHVYMLKVPLGQPKNGLYQGLLSLSAMSHVMREVRC